MKALKTLTCDRSRGLIWVCDISRSSSSLNDDTYVSDLEEFLPRFYWLTAGLVHAVQGELVKWTGDGFLAWFNTPLHRSLGTVASGIFRAAWYLSFLVNVTQLGLTPKRKFRICHGVTYEPDAIQLKFADVNGLQSVDLMGRSVVFAFRLSAIRAKFPHIVTQFEVVRAARKVDPRFSPFRPMRLSAKNRLIYFKGHRWGTDTIYATVSERKRKLSREALLRQIPIVLNELERDISKDCSHSPPLAQFRAYMSDGPDWCKELLAQEIRIVQDNMLAPLRKMEAHLKEASNK